MGCQLSDVLETEMMQMYQGTGMCWWLKTVCLQKQRWDEFSHSVKRGHFAQEHRQVMTIDIPGAFMQVDIDELIHVQLEGPMVELLTSIDPAKKYCMYMSKENGKQVLYIKLQKALYGTLQATILFWKDLTKFLTEELGSIVNLYDNCVINKMIDRKQWTIIWHVDNLKLFPIKQSVLDDIANKLRSKYRQVAPLVIHCGIIHDYLRMTINYSDDNKVKFMMCDYVEGVLDGAPPTEMDGLAITPAASNLFTVREDTNMLDDEWAELYHHITAQLLYLCQCVRLDLQPTVAFLTTRVTQPDVNDWKKLTHCIWYLRDSKDLYLTLEADNDIDIKWWIDASFAIHPDMKSHMGETMSFGKGSVYSMSRKQWINTKSSTAAEIIGVDDGMPLVIWTHNFMSAQGYQINDNVVYQDNQSAILLETNWRAFSSGRCTQHIDIQYFFVTDWVKHGDIWIEYFPTGDMVADFFTKPLQGSLFHKLQAIILNIPSLSFTSDAAASQECVEKVASYADMVQGTHGKSSDIADAMCQPVLVNGRREKTAMQGGKLSLLSANW